MVSNDTARMPANNCAVWPELNERSMNTPSPRGAAIHSPSTAPTTQ